MTREPHLPPPRRSVAPIPAAVPKVGPVRPTKLPAVDERTLGNGLRVLAVRTRGIPMVQARLVLPAPRPKATGADRAKQLVLAETLLSGTQRRDSVAVAEALQRMGGTLVAGIDSEDVRLRGSALSPSLPDLLALMGEVLAEPAFPKGEVEIERARMAQEVLLQRADPAVLARMAFKRRLFGDLADAIGEECAPVVGRHLVKGVHHFVEVVGLDHWPAVGLSVEEMREVVHRLLIVGLLADDGVGLKPDERAFIVIIDAAAFIHPSPRT